MKIAHENEKSIPIGHDVRIRFHHKTKGCKLYGLLFSVCSLIDVSSLHPLYNLQMHISEGL